MNETPKKKPYSDRRWWDNPHPVDILCNGCKNRIDLYETPISNSPIKCAAFPDGIPMSHISRGEDENFHEIRLTKVMAKNCNNGIGFDPIEGITLHGVE